MKYLLTLLCCLVGFSVFSQAPPVVFSDPFEEPEGYDDIILTNDGQTVLLNLTNKSLIMDFYDRSHKLVHHFENTEEIWDKGGYRDRYIRGNYMIGGQLVIFLQGNHKNQNPTLHRISISPETGKIVSSEVTAVIPPEAQSQRRAAKYVDDGQMYSVRKDPNSDAYAVASYFIQDLDGAALPYVIHYDGQHKELGRSVIRSPRFVFSYFEDMLVLGTDEVWIATTPFNNGKGNRESSAVMLTRLRGNDTSSALVHNWNSWKPASAWLAYNAKEQTIQMMTRVLMNSQSASNIGPGVNKIINTYAANVIALDRQAGTFKYGKSMNYSLVTKSRNLNYDISAPYVGLPKQMQVRDGILTVISEEDSKLPSHDVGIVDYDTSGTPIAGYAVRKGTASGSRSGMGWASAGFYDFEHFNTPSGRYVFFNDHPANFERDAEKTPKYLTGVGDANTICYRLGESGGLSKFYLFGTPDKSFDNRFADFSTDDYNQASAEYAVLIIERSGRSKQARIAWVQMKNTP